MTTAYGLPAYQQVADDLREAITQGALGVGDPIPSTTQLCAQYEVSATVARAAVAKLREEGLVRGQPGKAVFVVATPQSVKDEGIRLEVVAGQVDDIRRGLDDLSTHVKDALDNATVGELQAGDRRPPATDRRPAGTGDRPLRSHRSAVLERFPSTERAERSPGGNLDGGCRPHRRSAQPRQLQARPRCDRSRPVRFRSRTAGHERRGVRRSSRTVAGMEPVSGDG